MSEEEWTTAKKMQKQPQKLHIRSIIRAFQENWKMNYLASPIPDRYKPQCLICYETLSENKKSGVKKSIICQNMQRALKNFPINSEELKTNIKICRRWSAPE